MRIHSLNFQLQAMVFVVLIGSVLVLSVLYRITQNITGRTEQISKSADLNTLITDWQNELNVGTRSRIKYIELKKEIFLTNYLNSISKISDFYTDIKDLAPQIDSTLMDSLDLLHQSQTEYGEIAGSLRTSKKLSKKKLQEMVGQLQFFEEDLKSKLHNLVTFTMVQIRNKNLASLQSTMDSSRLLIMWTTGTFMIFLVLIWFLLKRKILQPLKILELGAKEIGEGALGLQVEVDARGEIGDLVSVLNRMSIQLKNNQDMQSKFQKLETIDQMITTVSHEINNPLMIIGGNAEYILKLAQNNAQKLEETIQKIITEVKNLSVIAEGNLTEEQLHQVNNPLMIISGYVEFIEKIFNKNNVKLDEKLGKISNEVRRIFEVTQKLKLIKNPIVENYVGAETTMIDLKKSS